jgi:hypothetical protein
MGDTAMVIRRERGDDIYEWTFTVNYETKFMCLSSVEHLRRDSPDMDPVLVLRWDEGCGGKMPKAPHDEALKEAWNKFYAS